MMEHWFVDPMTLIKMGLDGSAHGKRVGLSQTAFLGRFRENTQSTETGGLLEMTSAAMAWAPPEIPVEPDDILVFDEKYYRVTEVVKAKRGGGTEHLFKKCQLEADAEPVLVEVS